MSPLDARRWQDPAAVVPVPDLNADIEKLMSEYRAYQDRIAETMAHLAPIEHRALIRHHTHAYFLAAWKRARQLEKEKLKC